MFESLPKAHDFSDAFYNAQATMEDLYAKLQSQAQKSLRPKFHFATPGGWCNDPNGFSFYKGKVHLFFQYNPYSIIWGPMHWGHVTTEDFLNWSLCKLALAPDTPGDHKGCFSGTAIEYKGNHLIAYTGVTEGPEGDVQNQCFCVGDGETYYKTSNKATVTFKDIPFHYNKEHFRDPKIWEKDGSLYMACVIKSLEDRGALILFKLIEGNTEEGRDQWVFQGVLDSSKDDLSHMWECPDILTLDGQDIIILSPQEMKENPDLGFHEGNNSVYMSGVLDYDKVTFERDKRIENSYTASSLDYGLDFYAPETTALPDGRTILIGWMQSWESYITPEDYLWSGMMTLPRELKFHNGRLLQLPIYELTSLRTNRKQGLLKDKLEFINRRFELIIENVQTFFISLKIGKEKSVEFICDTVSKTIGFNRDHSLTPGLVSERKANYGNFTDGPLCLDIIVDTCSMEVFVNQGQMCFTSSFFLPPTEEKVSLEINQGFLSYTLWSLEGECK